MIPDGRMFAQIDKFLTIQGYAPDECCVRLAGVSPNDFATAAFDTTAGCSTYAIDVHWSDIGFAVCWGCL